jgi:alpha-L-rhamnosidase
LLAAEFAGILNKVEDSVQFSKLAEQIKKRIIAKYRVPHTGRFDNGTQSAQLFALWYDLSPEKEKSLEVLWDEFKRHQEHVSSGIFGVMMMFDVLRENNRNDMAYTIANQRSYPGWGYMLANGATTLWESWEYPDNGPSQNHPMFGSIDEWFYRSLLGINPLAPGFKKIQIKPQPADLSWAKGSYLSIRGKIVCDWSRADDAYTLNIGIPPNTRAEVWILNKGNGEVTEHGKTLRSMDNVKLINYVDGYTVVEVGPGDYAFRAPK